MKPKINSISGGKLPLKTPQTEPLENNLFPLEEQHSERKKRYPYRSLNPKKKGGSTNSLWMELYPEPKKRTGGTLPDDGGLFK